MTYRATVNGHAVIVDPTAAGLVEVEPGVYSALAGTRSILVRVQGDTVEVAGRTLAVEVIDPRDEAGPASNGTSGGAQKIKSPMPGKVVRVLVEEGEEVGAQQGLVVVEAMKMQNEMKAPRAGVVRSVKTAAGATVTAGEVLVILE